AVRALARVVLADRHAESGEGIEQPGLRVGHLEAARSADAIGKEAQRPTGRRGGIQLAQAAGGRIARIDETALAARLLLRVHALEIRLVQEDLAPDLEQLRRGVGAQA